MLFFTGNSSSRGSPTRIVILERSEGSKKRFYHYAIAPFQNDSVSFQSHRVVDNQAHIKDNRKIEKSARGCYLPAVARL